MVEIISKRDGPRREDRDTRRLIERNRGTIERIAGHLTGGAFSTPRPVADSAPETRGPIVHVLGGRPGGGPPRPYVRVSPNGRVVMVDHETGRQMAHLGEIRRSAGVRRFVLATRENGFFAPLDPELAEAIEPLDQLSVADEDAEEQLSSEIGRRLGID